jgi:iron complex transport system substrate-binding protein
MHSRNLISKFKSTPKWIFWSGSILLGCLILSGFLLLYRAHQEVVETGNTRIVRDMSGAMVKVPSRIKRVGDAWYAHNEVVVMLGADRKIVATSLSEKMSPWIYRVAPGMKKAQLLFVSGLDMNVESLVKLRPDVVFMSAPGPEIQHLANLDIPVVVVNFKDFESLRQCFRLTADLLGDEAPQ